MSPSTGQPGIEEQDGQGGGRFRGTRARRLRWAVPAGVVVATAGGVLAASLVATAQATPELPSRTPAQLLAAVAGRTGPLPAFTGTVVETASLGFPELPGGGDPTSLQSLLTGSHTIRVWYADPQHLRLAIPGQLSETDVIRNGQNLWTWSSTHNTVTHTRLAAGDGHEAEPPMTKGPLTPQQAANQVLAAVGPTTTVSIASNVTVAGEPAYELVLAPKDSRSLIGQVRIAIDAHRSVPLRVQVFARGSSAPAFQIGFTSIAFTRPAAANFDFKAPAGAKVQESGTAGPLAAGPIRIRPVPAGARPGAVVRIENGRPVIMRNGKVVAAKGTTPIPPPFMNGGQAVVRNGKVVQVNCPVAVPLPSRDGKQIVVRNGKAVAVTGRSKVPVRSGTVIPAKCRMAIAAEGGPRPTVIGKGWLAVAVNPSGLLGGPALGDPGGLAGRELNALLGSASQVSGTWGSGRLVRTKILSILLTSDGHMLAGAVTPDVLYSAAAKTSQSGQASRAGK
ncbi:MAG: LolA family protein [Micromonosporaceae bacterium]